MTSKIDPSANATISNLPLVHTVPFDKREDLPTGDHNFISAVWEIILWIKELGLGIGWSRCISGNRYADGTHLAYSFVIPALQYPSHYDGLSTDFRRLVIFPIVSTTPKE